MRIPLLQFEIVVRWIIGGVFAAAALPKLANPHEFSAIIGAYGILPDSFLLATAILIPVLELIFAAGFVLKMRWGGLGILAMLVFFICILTYAIVQGFDIDCGCFGPEDVENHAFSGLRLALVRDLILIVFLLFSMGYRWYFTPRQPEKT